MTRPLVVTVTGTMTDWFDPPVIVRLHVPVAIGVIVKVGDGGDPETDATPAHVLVCVNEPG